MLLVFTLILGLCLLTTTTLGFQEQSVPAVQPENPPSVDQILDRMKIHNEWQGRYLIEYRAQRTFHAANLRFEEDATLEVRTTFRRPDTIESQVLRAEGSRLIRERVFDNILKAEVDTHSKLVKQQVDSSRSTLYPGITASATSVRNSVMTGSVIVLGLLPDEENNI